MTSKSALIRYITIDKRLRNKSKPPPTTSELHDLCEKRCGTPLSRRTIEKDLFDMRYDTGLQFFAPIQTTHAKKGLYYSNKLYSIARAIESL